MLIDRVGSLAGECDLDGDERIVVKRGHGLQVAGDSGMDHAVAWRSNAARHLHLHFGHAQSSLAGIVGEAHRQLVQEAQDGLFVLGLPLVQVAGIGFGDASALALCAGGIAGNSLPPWVRMAR